MFSKILTSALLSGAIAGMFIGVLNLIFTQPLLMTAELYESGAVVHFTAQASASQIPNIEGIETTRLILFLAFSVFLYCGYALVMTSGFAMAEEQGRVMSVQNGFLWGLAGFVIVQLAPALSLAPELPGFAKVDIGARQLWYFATLACAAVSVLLIVMGPRIWYKAAGVLLFFAPHIIGAPMPEAFSGPIPPEIAALFATRSLGIGFLGWCALGVLCGYFWTSTGQEDA